MEEEKASESEQLTPIFTRDAREIHNSKKGHPRRRVENLVMPFLIFNAGNHEWGFDVPYGFIPAIGDTVTLWHAMPDDTEGYTEDAIDGVVTKRRWGFASDFRDDECVEFEVELESELPEGHVANSTEWPAAEWSKRRQELEVRLDRIRRGLPPTA